MCMQKVAGFSTLKSLHAVRVLEVRPKMQGSTYIEQQGPCNTAGSMQHHAVL